MRRLDEVRRVLSYTLILNMAVAGVKMLYGYKTDSISMLSDGFHSFFDGISNVIGLVGIWVASKPPDKCHPYGHRRYETLSTIAVALLIFIGAFEIFKKAYFSFKNPPGIEVTTVSFTIMVLTILINITVMTYETRKGQELKSDFLLADAIHTKTDVFVSISVIISLIAAKMGYPLIDSITAILIGILIARMGFGILRSAADVLTDAACIDTKAISDVVMLIEGVKGCHEIRTRGREGAVNLDLHVLVDPQVEIHRAHDLAHSVEEAIKEKFPSVVDVVVHVEPHNK